jgi:MFS family permease
MRLPEAPAGYDAIVTSRLRGTYALGVAIVVLGLCPDLVLSTGFLPLSTVLASDLGTSPTWLQVANGLSNAAFAVGVVVAAQLGQRFVLRPLFLEYVAAFVIGSVLAALAPALPLFLLGRVLQGGSTGLMMISALPPLIVRFGVGRLPWTVAIVNLGLFGATTLGPVVGGVVAGSGAWRALLWAVAALGTMAFVAVLLGYPVLDPVDPSLPVDAPALALTAIGAVLLFLATSLVTATSLSSWIFWVLSLSGLAALVWLVVHERGKERSLMPVRELATQLPVTGTLIAMVAGATFVTAVELVQLYLADVARLAPAEGGRLFWPMPVALVPAAVLFGVLFRTRYLPVLVNVGLVAIAVGCALLLTLSASGATSPVGWAAALLGFGAGATVAPGLFLAGLGVRSQLLGRAFALVQLLRLTATFAVGPVVLFLAQVQSSPAAGIRLGVWITVVLAVVGLAVSLVVPLLSGARLAAPDLAGWLEDGQRALASPATAVHVRPGVSDEDAHRLVPDLLRRRR